MSVSKPTSGKRIATGLLALGFAISSMVPPALADPSGGRIISGSGAISQTPGASVINQATDRLIIEWDSFDTSSGQSVRFNQPSSASSVLNRILSNQATVFDGSLFANGNVVIVNGSGIHFGPNSRVDVGSLIASTADISNSNFLNNRLIFDRPGRSDASITNAGNITIRDTGLAALVAPGVENSGLIQANLGTVILAAGEAHTIDFNGDGLMSFTITKPTKAIPKRRDGTALNALVTNKGTVEANGGTIVMAARQASRVLDNAINMSGVARANSVGVRNGKIVLFGGKRGRVKVSGKVRARGKKRNQRGGRVHVTGRNIALTGADIDVSGKAGGGEVLIGGAYKGGPLDGASSIGYLRSGDLVSILTGKNAGAAGNNYIPTAETVFAGSDTTINVSALDDGNGGRAILWADDTTIFNGSILARGGDLGGDGGFIETSGAGRLGVGATASVDALAPNGAVGDWLLDPFSVNVLISGTATLAEIGDTTDTAGVLTVDPTVLNAATANVSIFATDTITFTDPVSLVNPGVGLTVTAGTAIVVIGAITTNNGDITFLSDSFSIGAAVDAGSGTVQFDRVTDGAFTLNETTALGIASLSGAELDLITAGNLIIGDPSAALNHTTLISLSGVDGAGTHDFTAHIAGLTQFNALVGGSTINVEGTHIYPEVEFNTQNGVINVATGTVSEATVSLFLGADTINLDGELIAQDFVGGTASTVNVVSDLGGATAQNAVDVANAGATVNLPIGMFSPFVVDSDNVTVRGAGSSTVISAATGPVEIAADGVTLQDLLILGTSTIGEVGILIDGKTAPLLTGASIIDVGMAFLDVGIESIGDIGDGNGATVDVTIAGTSATDKISISDSLDAAIDLSDSDDNAVYAIRNLLIQDTNEDADALGTGSDAIRLTGSGGLTIDNVDIFGAGGKGIFVSGPLNGGALATISNTRIGTAAAPVGSDGIAFTGGILDTSTLSIDATTSIFASGHALNVLDLQSPSTLAINGGTFSGLQGALLIDNTGVAGTQGRLVIGAATFIGGAGTTVFDVRTSAGGAGLLIDFTGASGTTISGGATGLGLSGPGIALVGNTLGGIALTGLSGNFITLANGAGGTGTISVFDATNVIFDGTLGSALTNAQILSVEARLQHFLDDNALGFINTSQPILLGLLNGLNLIRLPNNPLNTGQIDNIFQLLGSDALYVFENGLFRSLARGALGRNVAALDPGLTDERTAAITDALEEVARRCQLLPEEYRIDCLGKGYSQVASEIPQVADYQPVRDELARAGRRMQEIVLRNLDRAKQERELPKTPRDTRNYNWASKPVQVEKLAEATREAVAVVEEAQTRLLRSAENSARRRIHYQRVSRSLGASRRILRS